MVEQFRSLDPLKKLFQTLCGIKTPYFAKNEEKINKIPKFSINLNSKRYLSKQGLDMEIKGHRAYKLFINCTNCKNNWNIVPVISTSGLKLKRNRRT